MADLSGAPVALTLSFIDAINRGDVDRLGELMAEDYVLQVFDEAPQASRAVGLVGWRGYIAAFPDYIIHPHKLVAHGPKVSVLGATTGSHLGLAAADELKLTLIWQCDATGGAVRLWRLIADSPQARAEYGLTD